ncbi:hypothetical protein [Bartonella sp. HY038]|uniref:hypothetical protein n=1 Tax=Bartonella sp. HY038 TaxID=2759660 RepID=UPI0015FAAE3D|nr:hypothetical protein [Bartonella sp. HY038]
MPLIIAASEATPPQFDNIINNDKLGKFWRDYCACVAAFKLPPWHSVRERCIAMLAQYLAAVNIGQASRAAIIRQVEAQLRAIPLYQKCRLMQKPIAPQAIETVAKIVDILPIDNDELAQQVLAMTFMAVCNTLNMSKDETIATFIRIIEAEEEGRKAKAPLAN